MSKEYPSGPFIVLVEADGAFTLACGEKTFGPFPAKDYGDLYAALRWAGKDVSRVNRRFMEQNEDYWP